MEHQALQRAWDIGVGLLCLAVIVASIWLSPTDEAVYVFGVQLPELCTFRRLTGMSCPGCGLTRSFTYMGHLDLSAALKMHLLGPPLYIVVALQPLLRARSLWRARQERLQSS
ncbi:MAG: hypothetical protein ACI8S6_003461 [Myxococcota bacterium]|jgi:hypothetical protein